MEKTKYGSLKEIGEVSLYTLTNKNGMSISVTDLGATLVKVLVPDRTGTLRDVVLGYDTPEGYLENTCYFGATIGRSGNRIDKGRFVIGGKTYQLDINDNENDLHSGNHGYHIRKWEAIKADDEKNSITFTLFSPDGDQGFPGNFKVSVTYTLTEENELVLHYEGISDADTVANLTNHSYFNLGGHDSGSIEDHVLTLAAKSYTPVRDNQAIPTGEVAPVEDRKSVV